MSQDMPWFKCNPAEWLQSCADMESEQFGYYARIILFMYQRGGLAPFDEGKLRHIWNCSRQRARKVRDELIEAGRIERVGESLTQSRVKRELRIAKKIDEELSEKLGKTEQKSSKNPAKTDEVFSDNTLENNETEKQIPDTRYQIPENSSVLQDAREPDCEPDSEPDAKPANVVAITPKPDGTKLPVDRLLEVAGPGLADPAKVAGLTMSASEIGRWLRAGIDFELDVVPVVQAKTAKARASPISTWRYFTDPVREHHARRIADLDPMEIPHGQPSRLDRREARQPGRGRGSGNAVLDACLDLYTGGSDGDAVSG